MDPMRKLRALRANIVGCGVPFEIWQLQRLELSRCRGSNVRRTVYNKVVARLCALSVAHER